MYLLNPIDTADIVLSEDLLALTEKIASNNWCGYHSEMKLIQAV